MEPTYTEADYDAIFGQDAPRGITGQTAEVVNEGRTLIIRIIKDGEIVQSLSVREHVCIYQRGEDTYEIACGADRPLVYRVVVAGPGIAVDALDDGFMLSAWGE